MLANWIKQAVTAGGTGNLTLGSADAGFIDLNTAIGQGPRFPYTIADGNNRESGIGYLSASVTLVRESVLETLVSGVLATDSPQPINVTTSARVMISAGADQSVLYPVCQSLIPSGASDYIYSTSQLGAGWAQFVGGTLIATSFTLTLRARAAALGLYVHTAGAGSAVAGIYRGISGTKIKKLFQVSGEFDTGSTGEKTQSLAVPHLLNPGHYIAVVNISNTVTIRTTSGFPCPDLCVGPPMLTVYSCRINASYGYSSLLPDELSSADFVTYAATPIKLWMTT